MLLHLRSGLSPTLKSRQSPRQVKNQKTKWVLFFDGTQKGLVLNMANGDALYDMTGHEDPEEWIGQRVELYVDDNVAYAATRRWCPTA